MTPLQLWKAEMTRGVGPWAVLGGAALVFTVLLGRAEGWQGNAPLTSGVVASTQIFVGPAFGAVACWTAQRRTKDRSEELLASQPRRRSDSHFLSLSVVIAAAVVSLSAGTVYAYARTYAVIGFARPEIGPLILVLATVTAMIGAGYALGRAVRSPVAAPLVAAGLFVTQLLWPSADGLPLWHIINVWPQLMVTPASIAARAALATVVLAAVLTAPRLLSRMAQGWRLPRRVLAWSLVVAAMLAVNVVGQPLALRPSPPEAQWVCVGASPSVCLWPANAAQASAVAQVADEVEGAVAGTVPPPEPALLEEGLVEEGGITLRVGPDALRQSVISTWLLAGGPCPDGSLPEESALDPVALAQWETWVTARASGQSPAQAGYPADISDAVDAELAKTLPEQLVWARAQGAAGRGCRV